MYDPFYEDAATSGRVRNAVAEYIWNGSHIRCPVYEGAPSWSSGFGVSLDTIPQGVAIASRATRPTICGGGYEHRGIYINSSRQLRASIITM
ncbi:hypothetical protein VTO73DRAFT_11561 [Trametes versicolor]